MLEERPRTNTILVPCFLLRVKISITNEKNKNDKNKKKFLMSGDSLPSRDTNCMASKKHEELKKQVMELLHQGENIELMCGTGTPKKD